MPAAQSGRRRRSVPHIGLREHEQHRNAGEGDRRRAARGQGRGSHNGSSFVDDLGADSLDTVELVMALEEEFETEIPDEDAEKITTVQQAIDYINERRAQA